MSRPFKVGDRVMLSRKAHKELRQAFGGYVGTIIELDWSMVSIEVDGFNLRGLARYEIKRAPAERD